MPSPTTPASAGPQDIGAPDRLTPARDETRGSVFANPAHFVNGERPPFPDPYVLRHCGRYYCYATGIDGVRLALSDDLVSWEDLGYVFSLGGRKDYWAPSVLYTGGLFYLYYSCVKADSNDPHDQRLQVAVGEHPEGPFAYVRTLLPRHFAIDSQPVRDLDGSLYLFYATNRWTALDARAAGTSVMVDRLVDPTTLAGEERPVVVPSVPQEVFAKDRFGDGRDWHTIEGPAFLTHHNTAFLTYSANAYTNDAYYIGYATATMAGPIGGWEWHKAPGDYDYGTLVRRSEGVEGTGHNSITVAPNLVDPWIVYHGWGKDEPGHKGERRMMRIDPLGFDGPRLITPAPTTEVQHRPYRADLEERFEGEDWPEGWEIWEGEAVVRDGALVTSASSRRARVIAPGVWDAYRAEFWINAIDSGNGARGGLVLNARDPQHWTSVLLDSGRRQLDVIDWAGGVGRAVVSADLPDEDPRAFRPLTVERAFGKVVLGFDGIPLVTFSAAPGPGRIGYFSQYTEGRVAAMAVTEHLSLAGEQLGIIAGTNLTSDIPLVATKEGISNPSREPAVFRAGPIPTGRRVNAEYELLGEAGRVDFLFVVDRKASAPAGVWTVTSEDSPAVGAEALDNEIIVARLIVDISGWSLSTGDPHEVIAHGPLPGRRFSVRSEMTPSGFIIGCGATDHIVKDVRPSTIGHINRITCARLRALDTTSIGPTIPEFAHATAVLPGETPS
ncbi:MAG: glycoside hydrolase family 43 protein [Propionibacteriaceae bacterium]|jgi:GH43 family beta-xylosidase|nr:glycoside hydrolase family 43 protein [Propionibacteriaceae bacterium]